MSSLIIANDTHLMMLEFAVEKLLVPSTSPFDAVIMSKYVASFRFLDNEWIDVTPNRLDYRKYRRSCGEAQPFHGGKSVVFSIPSCALFSDKPANLTLDIAARREISRYFDTEEHGDHVTKLGETSVSVCELFNGIVKELRERKALKKYLRIAHKSDPVSRSMKWSCTLTHPTSSNIEIDLYLRLSYLGDSVVTEIDRPFAFPSHDHFYAQEAGNCTTAYECRELDADDIKPSSKPDPYSLALHVGAGLRCECTDEQRNRLMMLGQDMKDAETMIEGEGEEKVEKKMKKKKVKDQGTLTDAGTDDKETETDASTSSVATKRKKGLSYADLISLIRSQRRGAGGTVGIVDRKRPCQPCVPCEPCPPCPPCYSPGICITKPDVDLACLPVCLPPPPPPPPPPTVCCYN